MALYKARPEGSTQFVEGFVGPEPRPWNDVVEDLNNAARNSALNIDKVLDGILRDLDAPTEPADDDIPF